ncbi:MAG: hypothetical protein IK078_08810 [Lachnospiraceae bacterium]|nr:hypothetical protein [Lachnospiraceae bacterium]
MFKCNYANLRLSFNEFHGIENKDMPQYGEFCLLELKDGRYTGGAWHPSEYKKPGKETSGKFIRGTADSIPAQDVARWHSLDRYDMSNCLVQEDLNYINLGVKDEGTYSVVMKDFQSLRDGSFPKSEQYCLLIMTNGELAAGRWEFYSNENEGSFIYAPALASHSMKKVWAWTPLSSDDTFAAEEERENEKKREEELNKNPTVDSEKFKYGTDIEVYYEKALEKLRKKYPWASMAQMKKETPWEIVPLHGQYVFGQVNNVFKHETYVKECENVRTADEFIDFLCKYTKEVVKNSDPAKKFKYGMDIEVYLDKAFEKVKKDYRWADKKALKKSCPFAIKQINGDWEFTRRYKGSAEDHICEHATSESFIENVERDYQDAAIAANPVVDTYEPSFGRIEIHGWYLERYVFSKLKSGDFTVDVTAGDRVTGGSRQFFITPDCFEAKTYGEFLDRYLEIVPGRSFGLDKEALQKDAKLKKFLGY